jgi:Eukaryotic translation initiation factor 3 subunit 8 N-terminus
VQAFYDGLNKQSISVRISFVRLENMYYIHDSILASLREAALNKKESTLHHIYDQSVNTERTIHDLATLIYRFDEANRTRATLYHIYHHSLHGRV